MVQQLIRWLTFWSWVQQVSAEALLILLCRHPGSDLSGCVGFTGRLIVRVLHNHRQRSAFSFAIGVRSVPKGNALKKSLGIEDNVPVVQVDLSRYEDIESAVREAKVVLNVAGPFWIWGPDVVK